MKRFKEFLEKYVLVDYLPQHGKHSQEPEPVDVYHEPVHGRHSKIEERVRDESEFRNANHNPHLGDGVHEHSAKLGAYDTSDKDKRKAVRFYTNDSKGINRYHLDKAHGREPNIPPKRMFNMKTNRVGFVDQHSLIEKHTPHLDAAIRESKMKHDAVVFHGTCKWDIKDHVEKHGGKVKLPAYTSTSLDPGIAHDYADYDEQPKFKHVLAVHLKKGQPGLHLGKNSALTEHGYEHEVLLPRGLKLNVHHEPEKYGNLHVWHATVDG